MNQYYIVVEEWLYPTESGRDVIEIDFDTKEEAIAYAKSNAEKEIPNFAEATGEDSLPPEVIADEGNGTGVIITSKMGLSDWYYAVRVFKVEPIGIHA